MSNTIPQASGTVWEGLCEPHGEEAFDKISIVNNMGNAFNVDCTHCPSFFYFLVME